MDSSSNSAPREVAAVDTSFLNSLAWSNLKNGQILPFSKPKVVEWLDQSKLEVKYLIPLNFSFVMPEVDTLLKGHPMAASLFTAHL